MRFLEQLTASQRCVNVLTCKRRYKGGISACRRQYECLYFDIFFFFEWIFASFSRHPILSALNFLFTGESFARLLLSCFGFVAVLACCSECSLDDENFPVIASPRRCSVRHSNTWPYDRAFQPMAINYTPSPLPPPVRVHNSCLFCGFFFVLFQEKAETRGQLLNLKKSKYTRSAWMALVLQRASYYYYLIWWIEQNCIINR